MVLVERTIQDVHDYVQGCVAELVLNLDEVGISDWEDHKTTKVIVPAAMLGRTIHYGASRNMKHISTIACLSDAPESVLPYIVVSQNSPTVQEHLKRMLFVSERI
jgi:RecJ-like exonuclease